MPKQLRQRHNVVLVRRQKFVGKRMPQQVGMNPKAADSGVLRA
jgi:hypothetical protein